MKTLAVLFFILTVINIPLCLMYASTTENNDYLHLNEVFRYFTIGNIGRGNTICAHSNINYENAKKIYPQNKIPYKFDKKTFKIELDYPKTLKEPNEMIHGLALNNSMRPLEI